MSSSIKAQGYNKTSSNIFGEGTPSYTEPKKSVSNTFKSEVFSNNSSAVNKVRPNITKSEIVFQDPSLKNDKTIFKRSDYEISDKGIVEAPTRAKEPKSTIYFGDTPSQAFAVKKNKTSNKDYDPDSHYTVQSAYGRKLKEFYSTEIEKLPANLNNTYGTLNKKYDEECKEKREVFSSQQLSAKDRKYHEFYSSLTVEGIKKITNSINPSELKINDKRLGVGEYDAQKDSKINKIEFLKSNIFHDENKKEIYQKYPGNFEEEKPEPKEQVKVTVPMNPWKAKIDWKDANNELIFHNEYQNKEESAQERKKNDLKDHFAPERNNQDVPIKQSEDEIVSGEKAEIKNSIKDSHTLDQTKLKKKMELTSVMNGKEFYQNLTKCAGKNTRQVSSYVVNNIKDFDSLKVKEVESLFKAKGIHIYDVKSSGSYINGNTNGNLSFKIRENNDQPEFQNSLNDLKNEIKNNMGLDIQPHVKKGRTASIGCLPTNLQWDNIKLEKIVKNNDHFVKTNNDNYNKTGEGEKFSKSFIKVTRLYKNNVISSSKPTSK